MAKTLTADRVKADRDEFTRRFNAQPSGGGCVKFNAEGCECLDHGLKKVRVRTQSGGTKTILAKNVSAQILKAVAKGKDRLGQYTIAIVSLTPLGTIGQLSTTWDVSEKVTETRVSLGAFPGDFVAITPVVENLRYGTIEKMKFNK
jgi:hypothetical protein